jgi:lactoylglutathione lyase
MPITVTWDHVHLRSPDPEATAAWLRDTLGGEIVRGPGRIDVKLGGANVFIAPVGRDQGQRRRIHQGADDDTARRPHLLHPGAARHLDRTA